jgi:PEP-CTERM motif
MRLHRISLAIGLATSLAATASFAAGNINSGTTKLEFSGTPFATGSGNANLWFGGTFNGTDMLSMLNWSYHQGVGTQVRPFSSLGGPVESYVGDTATFTWANAGAGSAGFARWDAVMTVKLTQLAPGSANNPGAAIVNTSLSFKSNASNGGNIAFTLYNHVNMDILGTNVNAGPGDIQTVLDNDQVRVKSFDPTGPHYSEILAVGAQRYEFNSGTNLRSKLGITSGSAGFASLATAAGVTAPDYNPGGTTEGSVAFQWGRTLAPGQTWELSSAFTVNAPVPEPGSYALMALGLAAIGIATRRRRRQA